MEDETMRSSSTSCLRMRYTTLSRVTTALRSKGRSLFILASVAVLPATAQAQFSAQPVILGLSPRDTIVSGIVSVRNEGKDPIQFRFRLADFDQTLDGDHNFQPFGKNAHSCKGRVEVFPEQATLLAGERQEVRVRMAPGLVTCWGVLLVEQRARNTTGIMIGQQIAVKLYGTIPELRIKGEITSVNARTDSGRVRVAFDFRNDGEGPLRPSGSVEIRTLTGDVVATEAVDAYSVLPGHTRRMVVQLPNGIKPGRYLAVPIMDFGAEYLAGGQARLEVP
jgi:hypothetical protein